MMMMSSRPSSCHLSLALAGDGWRGEEDAEQMVMSSGSNPGSRCALGSLKLMALRVSSVHVRMVLIPACKPLVCRRLLEAETRRV